MLVDVPGEATADLTGRGSSGLIRRHGGLGLGLGDALGGPERRRDGQVLMLERRAGVTLGNLLITRCRRD